MQLSEFRHGREVDIQTDRKWEEKTPGTKLKPQEDASKMKWASEVVKTRRERQNQNEPTTSHEWQTWQDDVVTVTTEKTANGIETRSYSQDPSLAAIWKAGVRIEANTNLLVREHKELKILCEEL